MKLEIKDPPRAYLCGFEIKHEIKDCGFVTLEQNEQLTFRTESGGEYDLTRKDFGFYATPSTNSRLAQFNLRTVVTINRQSRIYILLVEKGKEPLFENYIDKEQMRVLCWLDSDEAVADFAKRFENTSAKGSPSAEPPK